MKTTTRLLDERNVSVKRSVQQNNNIMSYHTPDGSLLYSDDMPPPSYASVCNDNSSAPAALRSNTGTTTQSTIQQQANHSDHQSQSCQCQCHETDSPARSALEEIAQLPRPMTLPVPAGSTKAPGHIFPTGKSHQQLYQAASASASQLDANRSRTMTDPISSSLAMSNHENRAFPVQRYCSSAG